LPTAAHDLSLFFIFQLLWFTCLDVYHAFLCFLCSYRQIFSLCGCLLCLVL